MHTQLFHVWQLRAKDREMIKAIAEIIVSPLGINGFEIMKKSIGEGV